MKSRRALLRLGAGAFSLALVPACKKSFTCKDAPGLSTDDADTRKNTEYTDVSPDLSKTCEACRQFVRGDTCGTCKVMKGPVHPAGTCKAFAPKS